MADNLVEVKIAVDASGVKPGADAASEALTGAAAKITTAIGAMDAQVSAQMAEMVGAISGAQLIPDTSAAAQATADVQSLSATVKAVAGDSSAMAAGLQSAANGGVQLSTASASADAALSGVASSMSAVAGASAASAMDDTGAAAGTAAGRLAGIGDAAGKAADDLKKAQDAAGKTADKIKDIPPPKPAAAEGVKGLTESLKAAGSGAEGMFKSVSGAMAAVSGLLAVVAAGGAMKGMIGAANEWNAEVGGLARSLGTTTENASAYAVAARMAGVDSETLAKTTGKLTEIIAQGGPQLGALGVKARDASGAIRPMGEILSDTMTKIAAIKNPSEQAAAGVRVFGGEWKDLQVAMNLNSAGLEEARKKAEALGLVVGPDAAAASKEYKQNLKEIGLVGQSLSVQFGNMLLPAVAEVGKWVASNGPMIAEGFKLALGAVGPIFSAAVDILRTSFEAAKTIISAVIDAVSGAFNALGSAASSLTSALGLTDGAAASSVSGMQLLKNAVAVVQAAFIAAGASINAAIVVISQAIGGLADIAGAVAKSVGAILHGDFEGAKQAWGDFYEQAAKRSEEGTEKLKAIASKGAEDVQKALMTQEPEAKRTSKAPESGGGVKKATTMADLDARLAAEKLAYAKSQAQAGTYYAYSQAQELAFWESKRTTFEAGSQDRITLEKKLLDMRAAMQVTSNAQEKQAAQIRADAAAASDTTQLDQAIAAAKAQADLGKLTADQLAELTIAAEQRRTEIMRAGLEARIELMKKDPNRNPAEIEAGLRAIQDLEASQGAKIQALRDAQAKAALDAEKRLADARLSAHESATAAQLETEITANVKQLESVKASKEDILKAERAAEEKRLANAMMFADARIAMLKDQAEGPDQTAAIEAAEAKKLEIMRASAEKIKALNAQIKDASPWNAIADEMTNSLGKAMEGVQGKTMDLHDAQVAVWNDLKAAFIKNMVIEPLKQMAMRYVRETAIYQMLAGSQVAAQTAASGTVAATKATESGTVIAANAAEAGSGAAASQAAIPIIGPVLAVAAMLGIVAKVKSLKSARGGFDIGNEEPLTQLHAQEMVLPQKHADTIRGMGDAPGLMQQAAQKIEEAVLQIKASIETTIQGPQQMALAGGMSINMAPPSVGRMQQQVEQRQQIAAVQSSGAAAPSAIQPSASSDTYQITISALDGSDVRRVLLDNTGPLAAAIKAAKRNGDL